MASIFITGGAGFIGYHLQKHLEKNALKKKLFFSKNEELSKGILQKKNTGYQCFK